MSQLVWFMTGTSGGLGEELAKAVLARGDKVIATARGPIDRLDPLKLAGATVLQLDVTANQAQVDKVVQQAVELCGGIDVLVPNAGDGRGGLMETVTQKDWEGQFETNVFGVTKVVTAILPHFRSRRSGTIAFMSSVGAYATGPYSGLYNISKHALEGYAKTLTLEVAHLNIRTMLFQMGYSRTNIFAKADINSLRPSIADYMPVWTGFGYALENIHGHQRGDPRKFAEAIISVVTDPSRRSIFVPLGPDALATIRRYADALKEGCDEYENIASSTDLEGPRSGIFAHTDQYWPL